MGRFQRADLRVKSQSHVVWFFFVLVTDVSVPVWLKRGRLSCAVLCLHSLRSRERWLRTPPTTPHSGPRYHDDMGSRRRRLKSASVTSPPLPTTTLRQTARNHTKEVLTLS